MLIYKETFLQTLLNRFKNFLYRRITKKGANLFLRAKDIISADPVTNGIHDPEVSATIIYYADELAFNDFFIDIGANIGLVTCVVASHFNECDAFEPNQLCFDILKINIELNCFDNIKLHNFGLGSKDEKHTLYVPSHNFGGAFILNDDNLYDSTTLFTKDGFSCFDQSNYLKKSIQVRSTSVVLAEIFTKKIATGNVKGVIKIDVEGMENIIIRELLSVLPRGLSVAIIFENWSPEFPSHEFSMLTEGRSLVFKYIKKQIPYKKDKMIAIKIVKALFSRRKAEIIDTLDFCQKGDYVMIVE